MGQIKPVKVLVIEDDPGFQNRLRSIMDNEGISYEMVSCGEDAIQLLSHKIFNIVITDNRMKFKQDDIGDDPNAGMKVLKHIVDSNIPCFKLIITAFANQETTREAFRYLGVYDYIDKNLHFRQEFLKSIREIIGKVSGQKYARVISTNDAEIYCQILTGDFKFSGEILSRRRVHQRELVSIALISNHHIHERLNRKTFKVKLINGISYNVRVHTSDLWIITNGTQKSKLEMEKVKAIYFTDFNN